MFVGKVTESVRGQIALNSAVSALEYSSREVSLRRFVYTLIRIRTLSIFSIDREEFVKYGEQEGVYIRKLPLHRVDDPRINSCADIERWVRGFFQGQDSESERC